jgi:hypothetical protein
MTQDFDIKGMAEKIRTLRENAEALQEICGGIPAVMKNCDRILADIRILEANISDLVEIFNK